MRSDFGNISLTASSSRQKDLGHRISCSVRYRFRSLSHTRSAQAGRGEEAATPVGSISPHSLFIIGSRILFSLAWYPVARDFIHCVFRRIHRPPFGRLRWSLRLVHAIVVWSPETLTDATSLSVSRIPTCVPVLLFAEAFTGKYSKCPFLKSADSVPRGFNDPVVFVLGVEIEYPFMSLASRPTPYHTQQRRIGPGSR